VRLWKASLQYGAAWSFSIAKKTGTRISTFIVGVILPPRIGAAIGFITSELIPLSHKTGARLSMTTAMVINLGLSRCAAPSIVATSMSRFASAPVAILLSSASYRKITITSPVSTAIPNSAM